MDDFVAEAISSPGLRKNSRNMSVEMDARASRGQGQRSSRDSGSGLCVAPGQKEMLTRLLAALERGKAAAAAAKLDSGASALSLFDAPAEPTSPQSPHGAAGLFEYIKPLRTMLRRERRSSATMLASDLLDLAQSHRRSSLEGGLMRRPTLEQLQGHDSTSQILPAEEAASIDTQITEKRKRLSGLTQACSLVNRPPAEKLQHIIDPLDAVAAAAMDPLDGSWREATE